MVPVSTLFGVNFLFTVGQSYLKDCGKLCLKTFQKTLIERARQGELPANHDLARALRRSLAKASRVLAYAIYDPQRKEFGKLIDELRLIKAWERVGEFLTGTIAAGSPEEYWLQELIDNATPAGFDDFPLSIALDDNQFTALLNEHLDPILSNHIQKSLIEWARAHITNAKKEPAAFEECVTKGWLLPMANGQRITFYEVFCIFFREELKTNEIVFKAYMVATQAELKAGIDKLLSESSVGNEEKLNEALNAMGDFAAFQRHVDSQQKEILGLLASIKDDTAAIRIDTGLLVDSRDGLNAKMDAMHADVKILLSKPLQSGNVLPPSSNSQRPECSTMLAENITLAGRLDLLATGAFIGRHADMVQLVAQLEKSRLVTVKGPGGVGKTRLVSEILKSLRESGKTRRRDSFVEFESLMGSTFESVVEAMLAELGCSFAAEKQSLDVLVNYLAAAPSLLVLDNCETAHAAVAEVVRELIKKCPSLTILATSQQVLGLQGIEYVYSLSPLAVPDKPITMLSELEVLESYQLFVQRVQSMNGEWIPSSSDVESLASVLKLTDGIPLAIELVAAWIPDLSPRDISIGLEKTLLGTMTTADRGVNVDHQRHRSMQGCLEWSLECVKKTNPEDSEHFSRLAVFEGAFTGAAVQVVCGVTDAASLLRRLEKASLVHRCCGTDPCRYRLLNLARAFAKRKLSGAGLERRLRQQHLEYYGKLASTWDGDDDGEQEYPCSVNNDWQDMLEAARLAANLELRPYLPYVWQISRVLGPFLQQRGLWAERERLCWDAVGAAKCVSALGPFERTLIDLGITLEMRGKRQEAEAQYQASYDSATRKGKPNRNHQSMALQRLCKVRVKLGKINEARIALQELEQVTALLESPNAKARSLDVIAVLHQIIGDQAKVGDIHEESLVLRLSFPGNDEGVARSMRNQGLAYLRERRLQEAEKHILQSLRYWTSKGHDWEKAFDLHSLADICSRQAGREAECLEYFKKCLVCRKDDPKGRSLSLCQYGKALRFMKMYDDSLSAAREGLQLCLQIGDPVGAGRAWIEIGKTYVAMKEWDQGLAAFEEGRTHQAEVNDLRGMAVSWDCEAGIHSHREEWVLACHKYQRSLKCSSDAGEHNATAWTLMNLATVSAAQGAKDDAIKHLDQAINLLETNRGDKGALPRAKQLRLQIVRYMRHGERWRPWQAADFNSYQERIRRSFNKVRRIIDPKQRVTACVALAGDYLESGREIEAALAFSELSSAYSHTADFANAEASIAKALRMFQVLSEPLGEAMCWHKYGHMYRDQAKWRDAETSYIKSIEIKVSCHDDEGALISRDALARIYIRLGDMTAAKGELDKSRDYVRDTGSEQERLHTLGQIIWVHLSCGEMSLAAEVARELVTCVATQKSASAIADEVLRFLNCGAPAKARELLESIKCGPAKSVVRIHE